MHRGRSSGASQCLKNLFKAVKLPSLLDLQVCVCLCPCLCVCLCLCVCICLYLSLSLSFSLSLSLSLRVRVCVKSRLKAVGLQSMYDLQV